MLRLDLGSGPNPREGFDGVDMYPHDDVSYVVDLDPANHTVPLYLQPVQWPFEDNSVDELFSSHLVEHIRDLVGFMGEAWRICKPGAVFEIHHPYQFNVRAWQDPTHVRCINEVSWFYFDKKWRGEHRNEGGFGATDFEVDDIIAVPEPAWQHVSDNTPEDFERAARNQINVISDLRVVLRCRKD